MNPQVQTQTMPVPRKPKRVRHYVIAYKCRCQKWHHLADFAGSQLHECDLCGFIATVEVK